MIIQTKEQSVGNLYWARNAVVGQRRLPFTGGGSWPSPIAAGYTVTYDANKPSIDTEGEAPVDSNTYQEGDTVTVLGEGTLSDSIYTFSGWTYDETQYSEGETITMPATNIVLTAVWGLAPPP